MGICQQNNFAIVTFDSDYFEISLINGSPTKIIWIRSGNLTNKEIIELLINMKNPIIEFLGNPEYKNKACLELDF